MAMRTICLSSERLNRPHLSFVSLLTVLIRTMSERIADRPWAMSVAQAAPFTPIPSDMTQKRSRTTFRIDEKMRKARGTVDFPSALNIDDRTLYMKRNGRPRKYIPR